MKMIIISILILLTIPLVTATINCTIKNETCIDIDVYHMSNLTNAHAEQNNESDYDYIVCCNASGTTLGTGCGTGVINLSSSTNAHAEMTNESNYPYSVCLNASNGTISCYYSSDPCPQGCLGTISDNTNAHVGNCSYYSTYICCDHTTPSAPSPPPVGGASTRNPGLTRKAQEDILAQYLEVEKREYVTLPNLGLLFVLILLLFMVNKSFKKSKDFIVSKVKKKKGDKDGL